MAIKLKGHLFDSEVLNKIYELLTKLEIKFNVADVKIGNDAS